MCLIKTAMINCETKTQLSERSFVTANWPTSLELFAAPSLQTDRQLWTFQETTQDTFV